MQIHNMAEIKATQFLMGYYGWPTMDEDTIQAANPEDEPSLNAAQAIEKQEALTQEDANPGQHPSTPLPIIEPLPYPLDSELTGVPMTASMTPTDEEGSSSIEPIKWGRIESSKERERMEDLRRWENINVGGYASQRTTKVYRHGRCYMCSKPVSSTNLDPNVELFCKECDEDLTALDCGYSPRDQADKPSKQGIEKAGRDDEEEWGRIPIPQSDDESEDYTWLDELSSSDEKNNTRPACVVSVMTAFNNKPNIQVKERKVNWTTTDDFAFSHGPRKDGTILMKDGSILTISELNPLMKVNTNIIT
jgi:hypothetical protein